MGTARYDALIIGGGHNGLVCAFYLARAGLKVRVLERRSVVGGAAVTEEFHPGYRNSTASYTVSLLNPKVIADMQLARYGLRVVERRMSNFLPLPNGDSLAVGEGGLTAREAGVVSGMQVAALAFRLVDPALQITTHKVDGDVIAPGDLLMEITGDAASILSGERVALNFAGRMSGIATLTAAFVAETRGTDARVTCTRKTTPGLRIVEKQAVLHGGGFNHRFGLSDAILICGRL